MCSVESGRLLGISKTLRTSPGISICIPVALCVHIVYGGNHCPVIVYIQTGVCQLKL